jgi:RNA polymerase sigma-70 factor, ECF subfamily
MGEQEIVKKIQEGDNATFKYLFDLHYHPISFTVSTLLRDYGELPDDYVLHAFLKLFENRMKIESLTDAKYYLYVTATNKARNFIRDIKLRRSLNAEYSKFTDDCYNPTAPGFKRWQAFRAIDEKVNLLPAKIRQVFILFYYHRMSCAEIAKKLKLNYNSVKQYNARALAQLRATVDLAEAYEV